jgi:chemotaxis receptor (MCP) glutamine deamidase CheD
MSMPSSLSAPESKPIQQTPSRFLEHLPLSDEEVFGREPEIQALDTAWDEGVPKIITLVGLDGMGKTAVISHWLKRMQAEGYRGAERVVGWSFVAPQRGEISTDEFLVYALNACGDPHPAKGSPWDKGRRLAHAIHAQRTVLILENVDALQYAGGKMRGQFKDPGLKILLYELSRINSGLCIVTTSQVLRDFKHQPKTNVKQITLASLSPESGVRLLRSCGVTGSSDAIKQAVRNFDGHPLTLTLLGGYLSFTHRGDIRKTDINAPLNKTGSGDRHVRRVVDAFTIWLQRKPELNILFMLSLPGRLIEADAMSAPYHNGLLETLLQSPAIKGLTEYVYECSEENWQSAITHLLSLHLLTENTILSDVSAEDETGVSEPHRVFGCHPLVREYFAEQLRGRFPGSWREAQNRLYAYYASHIGQNLPDTLKAMQPLLAAIEHGCLAGRHQQVFEEVYWKRIHCLDSDYCAKTLGAPGTDLAVLSHFFMPAWTAPAERLPDEIYARLLEIVALRLEETGRLREAVELVKKGMVFWNAREHWENAAQSANRLSRLLLPTGEVEQAVIHARLAQQLFEHSEESTHRMAVRIRLIRALHLAGDLQEAESVCQETESLGDEQEEDAFVSGEPFIGIACCDLFVQLEKYQAVQERIARRHGDATQAASPLNTAIGNLFSGKILLFQAFPASDKKQRSFLVPDKVESATLVQAKDLLNQAIEAFYSLGTQELLIQALLTRAVVYRVLKDFPAASADLRDVRELADVSGMPLYLTDYRLESARLMYEQYAADDGRFSSDAAGEEFHQQMHDHVEVAEALIWRTGYHVRDAELESLMTLLKDAIPQRIEDAEIGKQRQEMVWLAPKQPENKRPATQKPAIEPSVRRKQEITRPSKRKSQIIPPTQQDQEIKWVEQQEQKIRQASEYENVYLYPGELYIAERPTIVWTLLGSCIAVVFYHERLQLGAICHAQLPEERFRDGAYRAPCSHPCYKKNGAPDPSRFKYANCSIRYMYDQFVARGIPSSEITVKLFGGASVLEGVTDTINVGDENVRIARQVLHEYQLKLVRKDVGGRKGRTLYFYSDTGEVFMKKHRSTET